MTLLLIFLVMTAAAISAVALPFTRNRGENRSSGSDIAVYRDQLEEVDRDLAAGLIAKAEADAARVEISGRLLGAAGTAGTRQPVTSLTPGRRRITAAVA